MKIRFFAIYILAGAAFVGVSLWAALSRGKSAKELAAKYKLGGIMFTAWSLLCAASCEMPGPKIMCYEPAVPPEVTCYDVAAPSNVLTVSVKGKEGMEVQPGDVLIISIEAPECLKYACRITPRDSEPSVIQDKTFDGLQYTSRLLLEMPLEATEYKGEALVQVFGYYSVSETEERQIQLEGEFVIKYI